LTVYGVKVIIGLNNKGLTGMTYILGSVCSDGVVLVSDRKVMLHYGAVHEFEDKLFKVTDWMIVGSSGISGLFEKFRAHLRAYMSSPNMENTVPAIANEIERITYGLNEKYRGVLAGQNFDVLLGIKSSTGAVLQYIYPIGFAEGVRKYKAIGHGEPYGSFFLKQWWQPNMTMLEVAGLGYFIIKYIQDFELDNTVGIGNKQPQVWLIPKKPPPKGATPEQIQLLNPYQLSNMDGMEDRVLQKIKEFKQLRWG